MTISIMWGGWERRLAWGGARFDDAVVRLLVVVELPHTHTRARARARTHTHTHTHPEQFVLFSRAAHTSQREHSAGSGPRPEPSSVGTY